MQNHSLNFIIEEDNCENSLEQIINNCKTGEYIPTHAVQSIVKTSFPHCKIIHRYTDYHVIIKVTISELLAAPITNWKFNRPHDEVRCNHIAMDIYNSKKIVETMFYLSFNNENIMYDVIDGIHRFTALKLIHKHNNSSELDLLHNESNCMFGYGGNATWLYASHVFVNIRFNSKEGELIDFFKSLNKCNPISEIYVRDISREKKDIIESIVNEWQIKYKTHFSAVSKPNRPNVNRDRFMDLLNELFDKFKNKDTLEKKLEQMNNYILCNHNPRKIPQKTREKCCETNCWLFIYTCEELAKMIK
jgi:hypothetical protein